MTTTPFYAYVHGLKADGRDSRKKHYFIFAHSKDNFDQWFNLTHAKLVGLETPQPLVTRVTNTEYTFPVSSYREFLKLDMSRIPYVCLRIIEKPYVIKVRHVGKYDKYPRHHIEIIAESVTHFQDWFDTFGGLSSAIKCRAGYFTYNRNKSDLETCLALDSTLDRFRSCVLFSEPIYDSSRN
ncbi:hypothetical protein BJX99DRAFT_254162 [Aspergillus californicus]